jgi:hypothetical protein
MVGSEGRSAFLGMMLVGLAITWTACQGMGAGVNSEDGVDQGTANQAVTQCFLTTTKAGLKVPMTKIIYSLVASEQGDAVDAVIIFNRDFVDNTYGANAIGWENSKKGTHTFKDLVGSDHVQLMFFDKAGAKRFEAKTDYISVLASATSGYESLGVAGGDGKMILGSAQDVLSAGSSLADNFNKSGYKLEVDSPATDAAYTPNPAYPAWNFWVEYRLRVHLRAFAPAGFGRVEMAMVHASPSKWPEGDTVSVEPGDCPGAGENNPFPNDGTGPGGGSGGGTGGNPDTGPTTP